METVETVTEATEAPIEAVAEAPETPATEGEETQVAESEGAESAETTDETAEAGTEEPQPEQRHQTTANERIQQLVEKSKILEAELAAKTAMLEGKLDQVMQNTRQQDPELMPVDMNAFNQYVAEQLDKYDELRLEGRAADALKILKGITKLESEIEAHEIKRQEKLAQLSQQDSQQQVIRDTMTRLEEAAKIVQAEYKISDEVFSQSAKFFNAAQQQSPVLAKRYAEIVEKQGAMAAILFAKSYCDEHMGKTAKENIEKREAAKTKLPPTASSVNTTTPQAEVDRLRDVAMKNPGDPDAFIAWQAAKSKLK